MRDHPIVGKETNMQRTLWKILASMAAMASAWAAREAANTVWSRVSDTEAPVNPADRSVSWSAAIGWALLAGIAAGMARVVGRRSAVAAWERVTGDPPPGVPA